MKIKEEKTSPRKKRKIIREPIKGSLEAEFVQKKQPSLTDKKMNLFTNCKIAIIERNLSGKRFVDIQKGRCTIFKDKIVRYNGIYLSNMEEIKKYATHIVVSEDFKRKNAEIMLGNLDELKCHIVSPEWLVQTLAAKHILPENAFKPSCVYAPCEDLSKVDPIIVEPEPKDSSEFMLSDQAIFTDTVDKKAGNLILKKEDVGEEGFSNLGSGRKNLIRLNTDSTTPTQPILKRKEWSQIPQNTWLDRKRETFACQIKNNGSRRNYNSHITDILEKMVKIWEAEGEKWREYSYKKVVGILKKWPKKIQKKEIDFLVKHTKGLGATMKSHLHEITDTGRLIRYETKKEDEFVKTLLLFTSIWGVGAKTARRWHARGLRTLEDVRNKADGISLSKSMVVALKHYEDIKLRMPRSEVQEIETFVKKELEKIEPGCKVITSGSYRRGKPTSGDVDILITHPTPDKVNAQFHKNLVKSLEDIGFFNRSFKSTFR